jgi:hypothetical protein
MTHPIPLSAVHDAAFEVVREVAPSEKFAFEGVWSDAVSEVIGSWQTSDASAFAIPAHDVHLLSTIVIQASLFLAKEMGKGIATSAVDALKDWLRKQLGRHPKTKAGELSDADLDRIAHAIAERLDPSK